ncbi:MAG: glycosyltransferase family 4 protein [bacterium]
MTIALLTGTYSKFSGIDRVVERQADQLIREGHQVTVVCFDGDIQSDRYRIIKLGMPNSLLGQRIYRLCIFCLSPKAISKAMTEIRKVDKVYSHQYPMNCLAISMKQQWSTRYVYYNHGVPPARFFSSNAEKLYIWIFRWLTNRSVKKADEVISISQYLRDVLKKETNLDSRVMPDQIDEVRFNKNITDQSIRQKLSLGDGPVFLSVGRISPHKGWHLLISAFNQVKQQLLKAQLIIVGKPTFPGYLDKLKKMSQGSVHFVGFVSDEDLPKYYSSCDCYVTASLWEGFNLPLAEAQAMGKPVVAFNLGPHPEVAKNGLLVEPLNTEAFAQAMIQQIKK